MSLSDVRTEIAAALNTVPGIVASKYRPRVLAPYAAWPQVVDLVRTTEVPDFEATFRIFVVLPSDEVQAADWFDATHEAIADALADGDVGWVDTIGASVLKTSAGDVPAMFLTMRREA